jgi:hypothetical protein
MLELGVSQAQVQFTKILNETVLIVDKKANHKKAIILPYDKYSDLLNQIISKEKSQKGSFDQFVGLLDNEFTTNDERYNEIVH